jgi:hypothetical protein
MIASRLAWALTLLFAVMLAGCGRDPNAPQPVTGMVFFKGEPLDQGAIQFMPVDEGPTESGSGVENGAFSIPEENGLVPGKYKVAVFSYDKSGAKVQSEDIPGDPGAVQFKERIPAKYNTKTELTAEVASGGENNFEFRID